MAIWEVGSTLSPHRLLRLPPVAEWSRNDTTNQNRTVPILGYRVFPISFSALINPQIVRRKGERLVNEGCLSLPGYVGELKRAELVTVKGLNPDGKEIRIKADELLAQALEHEIDHLNGVLYIDRLESRDKLRKIEPVEAQL